MGSQTLELKWANHKSNMTSELQELYLSDALFDVTIACGEFSLKAHKTVLSASSTFFRKLFVDNPCKHPILIMTDVDFGDLKTIVEFMYQGEIHISREKLTKFLKTAERLKIKGLSSIEDMNLNETEHSEIDVDPHYSNGTWEHMRPSIQPQLQDITQAESIVHSSPRKLADCRQSETNQEIPAVKVEHELSHPDSDDCIYWQSECFDQTSSSSVLPDCSLSNPSVSHQVPSSSASHQVPSQSVSHQLAPPSVSHHLTTPSVTHQLTTSSVSHQLPATSISHQLPSTSVSHQLSNPSSSHQLSNPSSSHQLSNPSSSHQLVNPSVSHPLSNQPVSQLGVPLNTERFTYPESQTDSGALTQVQEENTGRDIIPVNLYQSQEQSPITIPTSTKSSFEAIETMSSQSSSQGGKTGYALIENDIAAAATTAESNERFLQSEQMVYVELTEEHHHNKIHKCNICCNEFSRHDILEQHMQCHLKKNSLVNSVWNYRFRTLIRLDEQARKHCGKKLYKCDVCCRNFGYYSNLVRHKRIHTGEKPYKCHVCQKCFSDSSNYIEHKRMHTGGKPYECDFCPAKFSFHRGLNQHKKLCHSSKEFEM